MASSLLLDTSDLERGGATTSIPSPHKPSHQRGIHGFSLRQATMLSDVVSANFPSPWFWYSEQEPLPSTSTVYLPGPHGAA